MTKSNSTRFWSVGLGLVMGCLGFVDAWAQQEPTSLLDRVVARFVPDSFPPGKPQFLAYPTLAFAPETSWEIGISSVYLWHARRDFTRNRLNEATAFVFFTLRNQYGLWFDHAIYTDQDKWFFLGKERIQDFPLFYYGYGRQTVDSISALIGARYFLFQERFMRKVYSNLFVGGMMDFQFLGRVTFEPAHLNGAGPVFPPGGAGSLTAGLGPTIIYDTRKNYLNVRSGWFAEASLIHFSPFWGSEYAFQSVSFDVRRYLEPFTAGQTLALQVLGRWTPGQPPFNQAALVGGETMMRGYYLGRFRDQAYMAAQAEYRFLPFPFSKRWGGAAFLAGGLLGSSPGDLFAKKPLISGGAGLRFLVFPKKDIFTRIDMGLTPERAGFYIFLGEAF